MWPFNIFKKKTKPELSLFILRGVPGCGKTTLGKVLSEGVYPVFEADSYFMKDGVYKFDRDKLHYAHQVCQGAVELAMRKGTNKIFVSNTFTKGSELKPYYKIAETHGYKVYCVVVENRHGGKNEHNVPAETIARMEDNVRNNLRLR